MQEEQEETAILPIPRTHWSRTFPAVPEQAQQARRYLAAILNDAPLTADAVACLGELANNAILHSRSSRADGTFTVYVELRRGRLRVEVHDHGGSWASSHNDSATDDLLVCGRGLLIVDSLADWWEITPKATTDHRKACFEMDMP